MTWMVTVPAILVLGFLSGWASGSGNQNAWFATLRKPWFMPPGWVFGAAWTLLYSLMGVAVARIVDAGGEGRNLALALFAVQLALNLAWSPVFFTAHRVASALVLLIGLDASAVATVAAFARIDATAAWLLAPYLLWLAIATALNSETLRLNRDRLANRAGQPT